MSAARATALRRAAERQRRTEAAAAVRRRERSDEAALAAGLAETVRLAEARGETVVQARGKLRIPSRDGLEWLKATGRLDEGRQGGPQARAADRFRGLWLQAANWDGVRSSLDLTVAGTLGVRVVEVRTGAARMLEEAYAALADALGGVGAARVWRDLTAVCGEGRTLRELSGGNAFQAGLREGCLVSGLDVLTRFWRTGG